MKLQQVLVNILSNAVKFTPPGGQVVMTARQVQQKKDNAMVQFVISDTGVGIKPEFLPHLFEPFSQESTGTTSAYGGSGLGLAISKSIVDLMDGHISVQSEKGQGTQFVVEVRLGMTSQTVQQDCQTALQLETEASEQDLEQLDFTGLRLLLAEDNLINTEVAVMLLQDKGFTVPLPKMIMPQF